MLSPLQKLMFKIHRQGFGFMCPLPIEWDINYEYLIKNFSFKRCICYLVLLSFDIWLAAACAYDVILLQMREYFNHGVVVMLAAAGIGVSATVLAALLVFKNRDCMEGINKLLKFHTTLNKRNKETNGLKWIDICINVVSICGILCPWVTLVCSLYFRFDPSFFVFEDIFGPYHSRSLASNCMTFSMRAVLFTGAFECARTISFLCLMLVILVIKVQECVNLLGKHVKRYEDIITDYSHLKLVYNQMAPFVVDDLSLIISAGFWFFVAAGWIIVKGHSVIPVYMYLIITPLAAESSAMNLSATKLIFVVALMFCIAAAPSSAFPVELANAVLGSGAEGSHIIVKRQSYQRCPPGYIYSRYRQRCVMNSNVNGDIIGR
ncbi:unnamed protein product [Orchesella dallaii]|uniref:Odorant receptor n=1 Tax=Orchesella dallaii TaxID=48710 RepID=A0ABP1QQK0_9HEXA